MPQFIQGAEAEPGSRTRRRPLHTMGVSALEIAHKAYGKVSEYNGPLSSLIKAIVIFARLIAPVIYLVQYQWLTGLAFTDDNILALENIVQKIFPPACYVFDKVDDLVLFTETLPEKFDDKDLATMLRQVPLLNILVNTLAYLVSWNEGNIGMDVYSRKYNDLPMWKTEDPSEFCLKRKCQDNDFPIGKTEDPSEFRVKRTCQDGNKMVGARTDFGTRLPSFKEALIEGTAKKSQKIGAEGNDDIQKYDGGYLKGTIDEEYGDKGTKRKAD